MTSTPDTATLEAKLAALAGLEKKLNKEFGEGTFMNLASRPQVLLDQVIPTGAISLDLALGIGGFPKGKIVELFGEESSGKSTLALSVARQAQLQGGVVAYVDAENVLDPEYCEALGIDLSRFWLSQPSNGEEALEIVREVLDSRAADIVVIDSVAALTPKAELEGTMEELKVGAQARMMAKGMRVIAHSARESGAVVIFINQIREKIGVMYGDPRTTPGGRALKFQAALRLEVRSPASAKIANPENRKEIIGQTCTVKIKKNKVGPPGGEASFDLIYGKGVMGESALVEALLDRNVWFSRGSFIYDAETGEQIAQGKASAGAWIVANDATEDLTKRLYATLRPVAIVDDADLDSPDLDDEEYGDELEAADLDEV